jgi:hypothetical protein
MTIYKANHSLSHTVKEEGKPDRDWYCEAGATFDTADITLPDLAELVRDGIVTEQKPPIVLPEPAKKGKS